MVQIYDALKPGEEFRIVIGKYLGDTLDYCLHLIDTDTEEVGAPDITSTQEYLKSTNAPESIQEYFQNITNPFNPETGDLNTLTDSGFTLFLHKRIQHYYNPEYYTSQLFDKYLDDLKEILIDFGVEEAKATRFNTLYKQNAILGEEGDPRSKGNYAAQSQFINVALTSLIIGEESPPDLSPSNTKKYISESLRVHPVYRGIAEVLDVDAHIEHVQHIDCLVRVILQDELNPGDYIPRSLIDEIFSNQKKLEFFQMSSQEIETYLRFNIRDNKIEAPTPNQNHRAVSIPQYIFQRQLGEMRELSPRGATQNIFRNLRETSDANRRRIQEWLSNPPELTTEEQFWIIQQKYIIDNPVLAFLTTSRFTDHTRASNNSMFRKSRVIGKIREDDVYTGAFHHPDHRSIPTLWSELFEAIDPNKDQIAEEIKKGNTSRITAVFLSLLIGHYPLDASGRANEDFINLLSGGEITFSEDGYRGFRTGLPKIEELLTKFKQEYVLSLKNLTRGAITDASIEAKSELYSIAALAEHQELIKAIYTGHFEEEILDRYPSIQQMMDYMKRASKLSYEFIDEIPPQVSMKLDALVAEILDMDAYERGSKGATFSDKPEDWNLKILQEIRTLKREIPNSKLLTELEIRFKRQLTLKQQLLSIAGLTRQRTG